MNLIWRKYIFLKKIFLIINFIVSYSQIENNEDVLKTKTDFIKNLDSHLTTEDYKIFMLL